MPCAVWGALKLKTFPVSQPEMASKGAFILLFADWRTPPGGAPFGVEGLRVQKKKRYLVQGVGGSHFDDEAAHFSRKMIESTKSGTNCHQGCHQGFVRSLGHC